MGLLLSSTGGYRAYQTCRLPVNSSKSFFKPFFGQDSSTAAVQLHEPSIPEPLAQLFAQVPKTENHLHLRGSTPEPVIKECMKENGLNDNKIAAAMGMLRSNYFDLTDFLNTYRVVPSQVKTPAQFKKATREIVIQSAKENVRLLEIRNSVIHPGVDPKAIILAIEEGIRDGQAWVEKNLGFTIHAGIIISVERSRSVEEDMHHAQLTLEMGNRNQRPDSLVYGLDISGDEAKFALTRFKDVLDYYNNYRHPLGLGLTIHAGETPDSEGLTGLESIQKALAMGADRIGHGIEAGKSDALKRQLREKQIPLELCPWSNIQIGYVEPYAHHPIRSFMEEGIPVSVSSDNRMMSQINQTRQLNQLWTQGLLKTWDDLMRLTLNGINMAFLPDKQKAAVRAEVTAQFKALENRFRDTIARYLPHIAKSQPICHVA